MKKRPVIRTRYRKIVSRIPHPGSLALIEELRRLEPRSLSGLPQIVWDHARGFQVFDPYGNAWIDFSSAIVLTNAGHSHPAIGQAIHSQIKRNLLHNYCNPSEIRLQTLKALAKILPPYLNKIFLLSTGSEAVEAAIKLIRLHGQSIDPGKIHILSFTNSFHGRTMGAQSAGGFPDQKEWMGEIPPGFHQIPFPECGRCPWGRTKYERCGRECLERGLEQLRNFGLEEDSFAGIITETFQGPTVAFMPRDYVKALRGWADKHRALLVFDEIQAGFGRTGKWFGFQHYQVRPDLICLGKGMSSSLPISAVAGRAEILDRASFGGMSSTHTGNPLCCAATLANIEVIRKESLVENAAHLEKKAGQALRKLKKRFPQYVGAINGKGLAWAVYLIDPVTKTLAPELARRVTNRCLELGLLMLQTGRGTLKIAPPLCITEEALLEGIAVIGQAIADSLTTRQQPPK